MRHLVLELDLFSIVWLLLFKALEDIKPYRNPDRLPRNQTLVRTGNSTYVFPNLAGKLKLKLYFSLIPDNQGPAPFPYVNQN
jgi:hypothetical protein